MVKQKIFSISIGRIEAKDESEPNDIPLEPTVLISQKNFYLRKNYSFYVLFHI
ncbi:MAG: hypothetical protein ACFE85_07405 [Candidatus Hodarchaeota archaeon]